MIANFNELATDASRSHALQILQHGLRAALPEAGLRRVLRKGQILAGSGYEVTSTRGFEALQSWNRTSYGSGRIDVSRYESAYVVAFGKAARRMAATVCDMLDISGGIVVVPHGQEAGAGNLRVLGSTHPVPDEASAAAAEAVTGFLEQRKESDLVIFLVSGGASALLCSPDGITLEEKGAASRLLLRSGASIDEFNCVRKHLSGIKGGRMVSKLHCDAVSLVISDVPGDDLSAIASGTTYCDSTTFGDALGVLARYGISDTVPAAVRRRLELGAAGNIPETPKRPAIPNLIVASNSDCLAAMSTEARMLGYGVRTMQVAGDVESAAGSIAEAIPDSPGCIIFGGETTVRVRGSGLGGRNQELVLRIMRRVIHRDRGVLAASIGTDGIDGNTDCAGAIAESPGADAAEIDALLNENDSNSFFRRHGGLIRTGHTGTNVADIGLVLT